MFGLYRLLLALLVVVTHIGSTEIFGGLAVWAFFMLSGFLITGVLNTRYTFSRYGLIQFGISRALRLLPTYWLSSSIAILAILFIGNVYVQPSLINTSLAIPQTLREWFSSVLILGQSAFGLGRTINSPSPSAWAIEVEIILYALSCLWVSKDVRSALKTFLFCVLCFPVLWLIAIWLRSKGIEELTGQLTYSFIIAAMLPYSIGSLLWHHRNKPIHSPRYNLIGLLLSSVCVFAFATLVSKLSVTACYILSLPVFAYVTLVLASLQVGNKLKSIDSFFGHMSYPVYLFHWLVAFLVASAAARFGVSDFYFFRGNNGLITFTPAGFILTTVSTLILSLFIVYVFELPIDRHRRLWARNLASLLVSSKANAE